MINHFLRFRDDIFIFLATPSKLKYTLIILFTGVGIAALIYFGDVNLETVLATFLGILFAWTLGALVKRIMYFNEDRRKVISDNKIIGKIYNAQRYLHCLVIEDKKQCFYYEISYRHDNNKKIIIRDNPSKKYTLPNKIENNFTNLLSAHGSSFIENNSTVRLDRFEETNDTLILETSRSNFYSHLVSNRAMDYLIDRKVSIRALYEYGPLLSPLEESKLSNHIGINALIFFNDGSLLLKHRGTKATISKNCLTSSVATRLILDSYQDELVYSKEKMDAPIKNVMYKKLNIPNDAKITIDFLGFARDVYEGGKPQFYFDVRVDISPEEYLSSCFRSRKSKKCIEIDEDKTTYICRKVLLPGNDSDRLKMFYYNPKNLSKLKTKTMFPEKSLFVNMYFSKQLSKQYTQSS